MSPVRDLRYIIAYFLLGLALWIIPSGPSARILAAGIKTFAEHRRGTRFD